METNEQGPAMPRIEQEHPATAHEHRSARDTFGLTKTPSC